MKLGKRFKIVIPIGAVTSFGIMIYMLQYDIWNKLSMPLKGIAIIGFVILFFMGDLEYERQTENERQTESR
jgi:Ca2+/Na+ antiporter